MPVVTPQPSRQTFSSGAALGFTLASETSGSTVYSLKVRAAHVVVDRLAVVAEAGGAVGHQALALGGAHRLHRLVLPDLQNLHSPHSAVYSGITWSPTLTLVTPSPTASTMPPPFVAQDAGEHAFRILAGQGEGVGVADAGGDDAHQHLAGLRRRDVHLDDLQRLVGGEGDGGTGFDHRKAPGDTRTAQGETCAGMCRTV